MSGDQQNPPKPPELHKAIVAKGRTVVDADGPHGPGEEVRLPGEDIRYLRASGFLVDPKVKEAQAGNGPVFSAQGSPMVKVVG